MVFFATEDSIKALKTDRERKFARDTLNFGLKLGSSLNKEPPPQKTY